MESVPFCPLFCFGGSCGQRENRSNDLIEVSDSETVSIVVKGLHEHFISEALFGVRNAGEMYRVIKAAMMEKEKPPGLIGGFSENLNLRLSTGLECEAGLSGYWVTSSLELDDVKVMRWKRLDKSNCPRF